MDRIAIARAERRREVTDELESERDRATALQQQVERIALELEGPAIDEAVFAKMAPEDVELIRGALQGGPAFEPEDLEENLFEDAADEDDAERWAIEQREEQEAEIERLLEEIAASERRQQALERYLEALGE